VSGTLLSSRFFTVAARKTTSLACQRMFARLIRSTSPRHFKAELDGKGKALATRYCLSLSG
jgi:hypothetical protein